MFKTRNPNKKLLYLWRNLFFTLPQKKFLKNQLTTKRLFHKNAKILCILDHKFFFLCILDHNYFHLDSDDNHHTINGNSSDDDDDDDWV